MSDINNIIVKDKPLLENQAFPKRIFEKPMPGLYIVATPIGNLKDITLRALEILSGSDFIACEDTRVSQKLLSEYGIEAKLLVYNDHNGENMRPKVLRLLDQSKVISLVSDAGTPLISDPGYKLVLEAREQGFNVTSIPGACAAVTALTLSGLPSDSFIFDGFLPSKTHARKSRLLELKHLDSTLVFYERASRLPGALQDIKEILGERKISIGRELTKKFEEIISGLATEVLEKLNSHENLLGEAVLMVSGFDAASEAEDIRNLDGEIELLIRANTTAKDISQMLSAKFNIPKKQIYARITELKK